ncbi:ammonium transporter [Thermococcus sp. Bubb.Bath]|uniref:ammonium transporter n=1 Tax=Thermococcus sp. Bubb.Bath TaxID=1638242 RepID=UPI0014395310|nr:ammonium transporter [Thermococcus sp. Bubb.Bath]NJF25015.1 ammonium transporter [Thermococcus sp. Bubb.Bath]
MFSPASDGFMLIAAALVFIMTPGLALFYGGMVNKKNAVTMMMQNFFSAGWTTVLWVVFGFSLAFAKDIGGVIGNLQYFLLDHIGPNTLYPGNHEISMLTFMVYQLMFAIITPVLMTGAFADRMRFKAFIVFLTLWMIFVYFPFAHWLWGGGFLAKWGVEDFAGGLVVHTSAGFGALAAVFYLGKRKHVLEGNHSLPLIVIGTALLWFGWFGFNAGSALRVDVDTNVAFVNTMEAAAFAAVTWMFWDYWKTGKWSALGFMTGSIAGLATITPAAGFVNPQAAMIIGITAAIVCHLAVDYKNRKGWDDALDVWGVHGIGGFSGIILLGIFGSSAILGSNGLIYGGVGFFGKQVAAAVMCAIYAFVVTYILMWVTDKITPVRVPEEAENTGLDEYEWAEEAYSL